MDERYLILIDYEAGYCGDFLACLINDVLNGNEPYITYSNNKYEYFGKAIHRISCKLIHSLVKSHYDRDEYAYMMALSLDSRTRDTGNRFLEIYNFCYDDDLEVYLQNVFDYFKDNLILNKKYNVTNIHYIPEKDFSNFDLGRLHDNCAYMTLTTDDIRYRVLFNFLSKAKTNFVYPDIRKEQVADFKFNLGREKVEIYGSSVGIDAGKLFFDMDTTEIDSFLTSKLNIPVTLNTERFRNYCIANFNYLSYLLGEDFMRMSSEDLYRKIREIVSARLSVDINDVVV